MDKSMNCLVRSFDPCSVKTKVGDCFFDPEGGRFGGFGVWGLVGEVGEVNLFVQLDILFGFEPVIDVECVDFDLAFHQLYFLTHSSPIQTPWDLWESSSHIC